MKGIILAGGSGTRLHPSTLVTSKQLLPIYDKPMIYYPLSVLMFAGVTELLLISTERDLPQYEKLLGDGRQIGLSIQYMVQKAPNGLAEAAILGEAFVRGEENFWLILGDNILFGDELVSLLQKVSKQKGGACIFGSLVSDPRRYGVVEFDKKQKVKGIEEKPEEPKSNYAITGLYYLDKNAPGFAKKMKPSARGELEICSYQGSDGLLNYYLDKGELYVERFGRGYAWLDTGTPEALGDASDFVKIMERRMGVKLGCIEEIAYNLGLIDLAQLEELGNNLSKSEYGKYILRIVKMAEEG